MIVYIPIAISGMLNRDKNIKANKIWDSHHVEIKIK
jgi:hypothetical protein